MKAYFRTHWRRFLYALLLTVLFCWPYLFRDFLNIGHDTFFHLSRIQGLAEAISRGDWFPAVYPYKNNGFGYASPLFYSDFFLVLPALLYNAGLNLAACYKLVIFACTFCSCLAMMHLIARVSDHASAVYLGGFLYLFSNYRITDVYVRGALGEVMAMIFLPLLLAALYDLLDRQDTAHWLNLALASAGLVLCHNLTFLFGMIMLLLMLLCYRRKLTKEVFLAGCKAMGTAFLLTAFFTLPMIEQLGSQAFYLSYYASSSDLGSQAMRLWQYFANTTVFGMGGNTYPEDATMLENIGWFLTFAPLLYFLLPKNWRQAHPFVRRCLILGYVFLILPSDLIPWDSLAVFRVIQFPWRLMTIAAVFLCVPAAVCLPVLLKKEEHLIVFALIAVLSAEGIWHLLPVLTQTFGITSQTVYSDITSGNLIDPYYSAFYVRVECAGGDYLPIGSPDFREYSTCIKDGSGNDIACSYSKQGNSLSFTLDADKQGRTVILPLTYYKGYQVYALNGGARQAVSTLESADCMVSFVSTGAGTYICRYVPTLTQTVSRWISLFAFLLIIVLHQKNRQLLKSHQIK